MVFTVNDLYSVAIREGIAGYERVLVFLSALSFAVLMGIVTVGSGTGIIPFIAILLALSLVIYLIPFIRRIRKLTRVIRHLEIATDRIIAKTTEVALLKGLVTLKSKEISIPINAFVATQDNNNIIPLNYASDLYIFSYNNKCYYLLDRFFDDFPTLRKMLSLV